MSELKHYDRWFGARWAAHAREYFSRWLGPEHTWGKVTGIFIVLVLAALFLVHVTYRVEGNFILRSDESEFLTAPFDGYIEKVFARAGDHVTNGEVLVALNRSELLLDQSSAQADVARYQRESGKRPRGEQHRQHAHQRSARATGAGATRFGPLPVCQRADPFHV